MPATARSTTTWRRRPSRASRASCLGFDRATVVDYRVFREPFAQPVCPVGFTSRLAPLRTPVENLVAADTTHLLPHDRSISDSLALSERLVGALRESMALDSG